MRGFKLKRQGSGKQCSRSEIGRGGRERGRVRTNTSQRKNRQGEVKEHGNADGLWCVYFNTRNIVGNVDSERGLMHGSIMCGYCRNMVARGGT